MVYSIARFKHFLIGFLTLVLSVSFCRPSLADGTPPDPPAGVYDEGALTANLSSLMVSWDAANEPESTVVNYVIRVGTTPGNDDVLGDFLVGNVTTENITGLSLMNMQGYFISVAAVNSFGLTSSFTDSDGIIVDTTFNPPPPMDTTPPTGPTMVTDDGISTTDLTGINISWDDAVDMDSSIGGYYVSIGTTPGGDDVVSSSPFPPSPTTAFIPVTLFPGITYYATVQAINFDGFPGSPVTSDGILADGGGGPPSDMTPPSGPTAINDDGISTSYLGGLSVSWDAAIDIESGILGYVADIGTTPGGTDTLAGFPIPPTDNFLVPATLTPGTTYYVTIAAINNAGLTGSPITTDGILAEAAGPPPPPNDTTPPVGPLAINDMGVSTSMLSGLSVSWDTATDTETGILVYFIDLGLTPGGTDLVEKLPVPPFETEVFLPVTLTPGLTYYATIVAVNAIGLTGSPVTTDGILAVAPPPPPDSTPPVGPLAINDMGVSTSMLSGLSVSWDAATDNESSVLGYFIDVGTTQGGLDILEKFPVPSSVNEVLLPVSLTPGLTYYATIVAVNSENLTGSPVTTDGILAVTPPPPPDDTPPTGPTVVWTDSPTQTSTTTLSASWDAAIDTESGITNYYIRVGTTEGGDEVVSAMDVGLDTSVLLTGLTLAVGQTYYISVKAENGEGLFSSYVTSDEIQIIPPDVDGPTGLMLTTPQFFVLLQPFQLYINTGVDPSGLSTSFQISRAEALYGGSGCLNFGSFTTIATLESGTTSFETTLPTPLVCYKFKLTSTDILNNVSEFTSTAMMFYPTPERGNASIALSTVGVGGVGLRVFDAGQFTLGADLIAGDEGEGDAESEDNPGIELSISSDEELVNVRKKKMRSSKSSASRQASTEDPLPSLEPIIISEPLVIPLISPGNPATLNLKVIAPEGTEPGVWHNEEILYADANNNQEFDEGEAHMVAVIKLEIPDFSTIGAVCPAENLLGLEEIQ